MVERCRKAKYLTKDDGALLAQIERSRQAGVAQYPYLCKLPGCDGMFWHLATYYDGLPLYRKSRKRGKNGRHRGQH